MNPDLRRIEAALDQATLDQVDQPVTFFRPQSGDSGRSNRSYSFELERASVSSRSGATASHSATQVHSFPTERNNPKASPLLPKLKPASFSSHRNVANPNLAMEVLQDIEATVLGWQTELVQVLRQIQQVYLEGPIVDGWLDSQPPQPQPSPSQSSQGVQQTVSQGTSVHPSNLHTSTLHTSTLDHIEIDQLMTYVDEICDAQSPVSYQSYGTAAVQSGKGYWLYGLDENGQVWSRPCPSEQIPSVSLAIARYQRLRQLLARKQQLETRLNQLAETLLVLQDHLES